MSRSFETARVGQIANGKWAVILVLATDCGPESPSYRLEAVHAGEPSRNYLRQEPITSQAWMARLATVHS